MTRPKNGEMTKAMRDFLRDLIGWHGAATPRELGPQMSQEENSARQRCKRLGLAVFDKHYWRITSAGRSALLERAHD